MQSRQKKVWRKKIPEVSELVTTAVLIKKIGEGEHKIPDISGVATTTVLNTKIGENEKKYQLLVV